MARSGHAGWQAESRGAADRRQPRSGLQAAVPDAAPARRRDGVPHLRDVAADQGALLLPRLGRGVAGRPGDRRAGRAALVRAPGRRHRPDPGPGPGEPVAAGLHQGPRPGRGVLAVAPDPQAGPAERAHPHGPRGRGHGPGDHCRQPRAVPVPVRRAAGHRAQAGAALRRLRGPVRRAAGRLGGTEIPGRPGSQPDQRQAPLRPGRDGRAAPGRGRGRGPLLGHLQARPGPARAGRRRPGGSPGPLAERADRLLRDPATRRGMDLPLPRRRPRLGRNRGRRARTHHARRRRSLPPGSPVSTWLPPRPRRRPPRSAPGRAPRACQYPIAESSAPRSGMPGAPPPRQGVSECGAVHKRMCTAPLSYVPA